MSDYRRLISYIYEYEGKKKGKNVGFVKLEAKNGQCRINLSVKRMYVGGNAIGVYLLGKNEIKTFLGNIFVRGGNGEFRATVDAKNVEGTGNSLDTYFGLTVHDVKNSWRSYTTIWEDAVAVPEIMGSPLAQDVLPESKKKDPEELALRVAQEIEEELEHENDAKTRTAELREEDAEEEESLEPPEEKPIEVEPDEEEKPIEPELDEEKEPPVVTAKSAQPVREEENPVPSPELEDPDILRYLQDTEEMMVDPEKLWQELRKSSPKIQPFDYEGNSETLTIRPQDIGKLPRENWVYGNNSFLLHGYYNFRYLILVRLENPKGTVRYLLGIPGHYYSNEKYMATMFGFPNFVLSKKQPPNDGRFGYWYTDLKMK